MDKKHLVNLLVREFKQNEVFNAMRELGINCDSIHIRNCEVVFDMIGFPKTGEKVTFSYESEMVKEFDRGYLWDTYYTTVDEILAQKHYYVSRHDIITVDEDEIIETAFDNFIHQLYKEYHSLRGSVN